MMAFTIKDPETHALAHELAQITGESINQAVRTAICEQLRRVRTCQDTEQSGLAHDLDAIALRCAALPDLDSRAPDDIIGYDDRGLPG